MYNIQPDMDEEV